MNLSVRIFLGYFILVGIATAFVMNSFTRELVPGMLQSLEEVLVDTANLLAEVVKDEVVRGTINHGVFADNMKAFSARKVDAVIWSFTKRDPHLIVYITDRNGIVIYDSRGRDVGKNYASWNDVYLTLQGQYGARTTRENPQDEFSSIMYVAAPIKSRNKIIAVVSVGKASVTVQPFVEAATRNIQEKGAWLLVVALVLGLLIAYWLTHSIRELTRYAIKVQQGQRVTVPKLREKELAQLANAMEGMRTELEGKHYVENYLHTLTHELKSPLAAIQGAAELLDESMPREKQAKFIANIRNESHRLREVVDRLLDLAALEKRTGLEKIETLSLNTLVTNLCNDKSAVIAQQGVTVSIEIDERYQVQCERFLLRQAINNLLDNAIQFSLPGGVVEVRATQAQDNYVISIRDHGPGLPDYAHARIFERFYSLPRPGDKHKSSGLGLSFVREVAQLHGGTVTVENHPQGGVVASLVVPIMQHA